MSRSVGSQYELLHNISLTAEQNVDPPVEAKTKTQPQPREMPTMKWRRTSTLERDKAVTEVEPVTRRKKKNKNRNH